MSDRYEYPQVNGYANLTNEAASADLISNPGTGIYLYLERGNLSVHKMAADIGGKCELKDTNGNVIFTIDTDSLRDVPLNFGDEGIKLGPEVGLQAVVSGGGIEQASVAVALSGHLAFR